MYQCPRCDKLLTRKELKGGKCIACNLEFAPVVNDIQKLTKQTLLETFANEVTKEHRGIDYYNTTINMLKAYLINVVCTRMLDRTTFYLVEDMEVKCLLFKVWKVKSHARLLLDYNPRYAGVKTYPYNTVIRAKFGNMIAYYDSTDFESVMDVAMGVYQHKKKKFGESKAPSKFTKFFTVRW